MAESFVQLTFCPEDPEQFQPPPDPLAKVKAEFSVSVTVIGLEPAVGSPVGPVLPLLSMFIVSDAFCWPCVKVSVFSVDTVTVGGVPVSCTHHPLAAPSICAFSG
jgi:hypothetical protein